MVEVNIPNVAKVHDPLDIKEHKGQCVVTMSLSFEVSECVFVSE